MNDSSASGLSADKPVTPARTGVLGDVLLVVAIALLVGVATFVLVREKAADERTVPALRAE
jgi:hypothetical protein